MTTQYRIMNEKLCGMNQALFDLGYYPGTYFADDLPPL